jgi:hypothetical protein
MRRGADTMNVSGRSRAAAMRCDGIVN